MFLSFVQRSELAISDREQALFMVNLAFVVTAANHGTGQHAKDLPPEEIPVGLKVGDVSKIGRICS